MPSPVHFIRVPDEPSDSVLAERFSKLIEASHLLDGIVERDFVAVKLHFGEKGNTGHLKPKVVKVAVDRAKAKAKSTFVADTNTLYRGQRANSIDHLRIADQHGFNLAKLGVPVLIADGLKGRNAVAVPVQGCTHYTSILVASDFADTDFMVALTHVTGHCATGLGAAIKNLGMGCTSRRAKYSQHENVKPEVNQAACIRCGLCAKWCPAEAITVNETCAVIDATRCIGCGECIVVCRTGAISVRWGESSQGLQEKLAENALGVINALNRRVALFSFLVFVEKECDCMGQAQGKAGQDIGILASHDPVAIDQATIDLLNRESGRDFIKELHPSLDPTVQLAHGEKIGLGSRAYDLVEVTP